MNRLMLALLATALTIPVLPLQAHHSTAVFDMQNPVKVTGTVKSFTWANPHTWLYLMVPNESGGVDEWEIEGPGFAMLVRNHWTGDTLKPGDKISVTVGPRRDGKPGGTFVRITRPDGEILNTGRI